jgi:hypothetical protein
VRCGRLSACEERLKDKSAARYAEEVPDFPVVLDDAQASVVVRLDKAPKKGSWFALNDGAPAQAKEIRVVGGEKVIYAKRGSEADRQRLKS